MRRFMEWNKSTVALAIVAGVLLAEITGYVVMMSLGVTVPAEYMSLMVTTLTVLAGVAGTQYLNGKLADN